MSATDERNERVRKILDSLYERAVDAGVEIDESAYRDSLEKLFSTTAWGFREILLVVIIGMRLDRAFKASTACMTAIRGQFMKDQLRNSLLKKKSPIVSPVR